jgi:DNA-binding response OmpR family regulator
MHCLIVDDDVDFCAAVVADMADDGWTSTVVHDGHSAIRALSKEEFDLVVLDIQLGSAMTGVDVACFKMCDPALRMVPMVIVSSLDPSDVRERGRVNVFSGPTVILNKPFEPEEMRSQVATLIRPPSYLPDA